MTSHPITSPRIGAVGQRQPGGEPRASGRAGGVQAALATIAQAIAARSGVVEVSQVAVNEAHRLLPSNRTSAWLWQPDKDAVRALAITTEDEESAQLVGDVVPLAEGGFRAVLEEARPIREAELPHSQHPLEGELVISGGRSRLLVPILVDGSPIGLLAAASRRRGAFTASHERRLEQIAVHLGIGLEQTRLAAETQRQQERLLGLQRVVQRLAARVGGEDVLDLVLEEAVRSVDGDSGTLLTWDEERQALVALRSTVSTTSRSVVLQPGEGVAGRAIQQRQVTVMQDYQGVIGDQTPAGRAGVCAAIAAPLVADGHLLGAVVATTKNPNKSFDATDVQVFELYAGQAAALVKTALLIESEQQRRQQLEAVRAVTCELTRELDLASLLQLILDRAGQLARSAAAAVLLWDERTETLHPKAWHGVGEWISHTRYHLGEGAVGMAAMQREGVLVNHDPTWPAAQPRPGEGAELQAVMAVPILCQDRLVGVLAANRLGAGEPFNRQDLDLLELFASQAAIAIENARLFEEATTAQALRELAALKAEFLNTVSHELRTPLSLIHGYAELLLHRAAHLPPHEVAQMSGEIYTSSKTLSRVVDDLLDFAHLDHGQLELRLRRLRLDDLLTDQVRPFQAQPGGQRILTRFQPGLEVEADPERIHQVIGNLLTNALTYTTDGPIVVLAQREHGTVKVSVIDEGPGLSVEEVGRVWESFYRGADASQLPNRGSGLGLSVVKQLVELHGGRVGVQSALGEGATFWFALPAADPATIRVATPAPQQALGAGVTAE